jgi:hypothetical protein
VAAVQLDADVRLARDDPYPIVLYLSQISWAARGLGARAMKPAGRVRMRAADWRVAQAASTNE